MYLTTNNMKVERQILHNCLDKAKESFKLGDKDQARDFCDMGIAYVASRRRNGMMDKDEVEGIRIELWLERFWMFLENKNLLLG
jgi:hypothetical protein